VRFHDGGWIPQLGYGVWQVPEEAAAECVGSALAAGYRSVDTAMIYRNERGVGAAIRESGLERADLHVTTKLWNTDQGDPRRALATSLDLLGLDFVDLYLIHWPAPRQGQYVDAWHALLELRDAGLARSVGVSNFAMEHLDRLRDATGELPVVNQIELHPFFQQRELHAFHAEYQIATEAWSPLGQGGELLRDPALVEIAAAHGKTPAQVILRWHLQIGNVVIPKSANPARIAENRDILDFELTSVQVGAIAELDRNDGRLGPDPLLATF